jgi:F-type H+-transporting ATPase subunit b
MRRAKRIALGSVLMLVLFSLVAPRSLVAQEKPASSQSPDRGGKTAKKPRSPSQQLVHETREAAGEEKDQTAEFKQSPSVVFIARITGLSLPHAYLFSVLLNFVVIAAVIFWAARKYLPGIFSARTTAIQKAMQEAQKTSEEARRRLADIESRLMKLDVEIGMMRDSAEKEAEAEEARIQAAAGEEASKIVASAEQEIAAAIKAARRDLTAYAADLAVALAQKQIHVDAATDQALIKSFATQMSPPSGQASGDGGRERR